ncbi:hypothetical protein COLO4_05287 [Corchorus olitorius]|uniref:Uncharacterized protein n=1 Tax=Corchorus olitorius TaxID=93759 RepID=A0A1R3KRD6_9ROSI|nr:hypothetical protein COLO4_05287 [Corchorus olitorius]
MKRGTDDKREPDSIFFDPRDECASVGKVAKLAWNLGKPSLPITTCHLDASLWLTICFILMMDSHGSIGLNPYSE